MNQFSSSRFRPLPPPPTPDLSTLFLEEPADYSAMVRNLVSVPAPAVQYSKTRFDEYGWPLPISEEELELSRALQLQVQLRAERRETFRRRQQQRLMKAQRLARRAARSPQAMVGRAQAILEGFFSNASENVR